MVRQASFDETGKVSSVPTKATESPQLETQGDLIQWSRDQANQKRWPSGKESDECQE